MFYITLPSSTLPWYLKLKQAFSGGNWDLVSLLICQMTSIQHHVYTLGWAYLASALLLVSQHAAANPLLPEQHFTGQAERTQPSCQHQADHSMLCLCCASSKVSAGRRDFACMSSQICSTINLCPHTHYKSANHILGICQLKFSFKHCDLFLTHV